MQNLMRQNANVWQQRPMFQDMLQYAAEDVSQLLSLVDRLTTDLGQTHVKFVRRLVLHDRTWPLMVIKATVRQPMPQGRTHFPQPLGLASFSFKPDVNSQHSHCKLLQ